MEDVKPFQQQMPKPTPPILKRTSTMDSPPLVHESWKLKPSDKIMFNETMQFLINKSKNSKSPIPLIRLFTEFKASVKHWYAVATLCSKFRDMRRRIHRDKTMTTLEKARVYYLTSTPVFRTFKTKLEKEARVILDDYERIIYCKSFDGTLKLRGKPVGRPSKKNMIQKNRKRMAESSDDEDDDVEVIVVKKKPRQTDLINDFFGVDFKVEEDVVEEEPVVPTVNPNRSLKTEEVFRAPRKMSFRGLSVKRHRTHKRVPRMMCYSVRSFNSAKVEPISIDDVDAPENVAPTTEDEILGAIESEAQTQIASPSETEVKQESVEEVVEDSKPDTEATNEPAPIQMDQGYEPSQHLQNPSWIQIPMQNLPQKITQWTITPEQAFSNHHAYYGSSLPNLQNPPEIQNPTSFSQSLQNLQGPPNQSIDFGVMMKRMTEMESNHNVLSKQLHDLQKAQKSASTSAIHVSGTPKELLNHLRQFTQTLEDQQFTEDLDQALQAMENNNSDEPIPKAKLKVLLQNAILLVMPPGVN